jgi:catechol 2,3-dioxygenase-like lactoylglutathione lyase family enzyme
MSTTARVEHIDHVQLAMPAAAETRAAAFYDRLLGIPRVPKPPERDSLRVHLGVEPDFRPARKAHPAFAVSDLDALCTTLEAAGHPVRRTEDVPGTPQWFVDDPFGNRIELLPA